MLCQEQLYRHCYPEMIGLCCRYAGDLDRAGLVFNNAMLRVFKNIRNYQEEGKFMAWVKTIVIHCCLDHVKQQNKSKETAISQAEEEISIPDEILEKISAKDIQRMISQLPKMTAVVFNLYVYEGFTHKQIAQGLGMAEGTSKWHVNEARKTMKTKLEHLFTQQTRK